MGFVVRDLERAVQYWTETLGVGPFFLHRHVTFEDYRYRGQSSLPPVVSLALGHSGDVQIEIIQQHDDRPSPYRDFLEAGRAGLQHVSTWLSPDEYDRAMHRLRTSGASIAHEGSVPGVGMRFAYWATDTVPGGLMYELAEVMQPHIYPVMEMVAQAAREWDGTDPVREVG
jgi:catechol 2,3-dioxygenase-like lactoylglutathione lyase family enzyme